MQRFRRGDMVEIANFGEGFAGSYYEATVVTDLLRKEYIVQYHNLMNDDESGPLREIVSAANVRPTPPDNSATELRLYEIVDAYDNDGWWVGKITGKVGDDEYLVYFKNTGDENAYDIKRLRIHQDWVNGNWVCNRFNGNLGVCN